MILMGSLESKSKMSMGLNQFRKLITSSIRSKVIQHPIFADQTCLSVTVLLNEGIYNIITSCDFVDSVIIEEKRIESSKVKQDQLGKECIVLVKESGGFKIFFREIDAIRDLFVGFDNVSCTELKPCYIVESNWFSDEPHLMPENLKAAYQYIRWLDILKRFADYSSGRTCVYFKEKKLELDVSALNLIENDDLVRAETDYLEKFMEHLEQPDHQDERVSLFKGVLIEFLSMENPESRLKALFTKIKTIYEAYHAGFDLYIEQFSYHALKKEVVSDYTGFLKRLDDAITNLRTQVLVIATNAIALAQYTERDLAKNLVILIATIGACILYGIILQNNCQTIQEINEELQDLEKDLKDRHLSIFEEKLEKYFTKLKIKVKSQKCKLILFWVILLLSLGCSLYMFLQSN